jgi:hypothetical protein
MQRDTFRQYTQPRALGFPIFGAVDECQGGPGRPARESEKPHAITLILQILQPRPSSRYLEPVTFVREGSASTEAMDLKLQHAHWGNSGF